MPELTYNNACIMYLEKNMECVGYRDYIIKQLNRLEQVECVVDAYITDNHKEPMYDTEDYMNSIREILERGNTDDSNFRELPSVTPTRKKGKWIITDDGICRCTICGNGIGTKNKGYPFCHWCGADMREVEVRGSKDGSN